MLGTWTGWAVSTAWKLTWGEEEVWASSHSKMTHPHIYTCSKVEYIYIFPATYTPLPTSDITYLGLLSIQFPPNNPFSTLIGGSFEFKVGHVRVLQYGNCHTHLLWSSKHWGILSECTVNENKDKGNYKHQITSCIAAIAAYMEVSGDSPPVLPKNKIFSSCLCLSLPRCRSSNVSYTHSASSGVWMCKDICVCADVCTALHKYTCMCTQCSVLILMGTQPLML